MVHSVVLSLALLPLGELDEIHQDFRGGANLHPGGWWMGVGEVGLQWKQQIDAQLTR